MMRASGQDRLSLPETVYHYFSRRRRARWENSDGSTFAIPLVSVGNLTVGGTGKTPAVQWLASGLVQRGWRPVVIARGYGGTLSRQGAVVGDGQEVLLDARRGGDEPLLHARNLSGVPVLIGRDREAMVRYAVRRFAPDVVVLDDAFQYWSLPRTLDIVLLDARRPFGNRRLLPLGPLRELPDGLQRADVVMLTRAGAATALEKQATREEVRRWTVAPIWEASHAPFAVRDEIEGADRPSEVLHEAPVAALSALAHNNSFAETLRHSNAQLLGHLARRDHHHWHASEVQRFARAMATLGARAIVTTEKDAVKLQPQWTQPLPLWTLRIMLQVEFDTGLLNWVESRLRATQFPG